MEQESNEIVYHYTKRSVFFEYIMISKSLRMSKIENSRDPYECSPICPYYPDASSITSEDIEHYEIEKKYLEDIYTNSSFLSFVKSDLDHSYEGCDKLRMWDQYGDGHNGVCLGVSRKGLEDFCDSNIPGDGDNKILIPKDLSYNHPIDYPVSTFFGVPQISVDEMKTFSARTTIKNGIEKFFFQKDSDYRDENEFRIFRLAENAEDPTYIPIQESLLEIIFGHKTDRTIIDKYKDIILATFPNAKLFLAAWASGQMIKSHYNMR